MSQHHQAKEYPNDDPRDQLNHAKVNGPALVRDADVIREIGQAMIELERKAGSGEMRPVDARMQYGELQVRLMGVASSWLSRPAK